MDTPKRLVIISPEAANDIQEIYLYGYETFGKNLAESFKSELLSMIRCLSTSYLSYPECRQIPTKSKMYRSIIIGSYLIIYRITPQRIEVLKAVSSRKSVTKIRSSRRIKL